MRRPLIVVACCALLAASGFMASAVETPELAKGEQARYKLSSSHFDVEFSVPPQIGRVYSSLCERAYAKFRSIFQVGENEVVWQDKCRIYLFATHEEFIRYATTVDKSEVGAQSGGYTRPTKRSPEIVLFLGRSDHVKLQQTLVHEMTHVFLQLFHKDTLLPTWLHEGFAQYFEFLHRPGESREKTARQIVKSLVRSNQAIPLRLLFVNSFPPTDLVSYSQAWSLIDFIAGSKELRRKTGRFVLMLKDRGPAMTTLANVAPRDTRPAPRAEDDAFLRAQEDALREVFGCSLSQFEAMWKRHVLATY